MKKYLVISLFAGHGMIKDGMQSLLINEYNELTGFYNMFEAEKWMRDIAERLTNVYVVSFFACCRQLYKEKDHKDCGLDASLHLTPEPQVNEQHVEEEKKSERVSQLTLEELLSSKS